MRWMVLFSALFLSGCVVHYGARYQGPPPLKSTTLGQVNSMVGAQQPSAYKVGFMEGCDSGRLSAGDNSYIFKKDVERFKTDDVYQQGWNDGFNRCVSGDGSAPATNYSANTYFGFGYYPYFYPGVFYSGGYYPGYYDYYPYYSPAFSIWLGNFGHRGLSHRRHHFASPWWGGHKHRHGGKHFSGLRSPGRFGGGHFKSHKGGGHFKGHKGGGHFKSHKGGGHFKAHKGGGHFKGHKGRGHGHSGGGRHRLR